MTKDTHLIFFHILDDSKELPSSNSKGLGAILNRLTTQQAPAPPPPPPPPTNQEPEKFNEINHWSLLADNMQASSLSSFEPIESYLSQDLLRVTAQNKEDAAQLLVIENRPAKDAFEVARHMVMCWVNAGYSYDQLFNVVQCTNAEDILPPRDPSDSTRFFIGPKKPGDKKDFLAYKFINQFKKMNRTMNARQIDYVVWRSLLYVMRGCDKKLPNQHASASGGGQYKVSYNYLPPGLREMENATKYKQTADESADFSHFAVTTVDSVSKEDLPSNIELSEDPMNIIIDPKGIHANQNKEIVPRRKYFVGSVSIEYILYKGKMEVYEISLFCQDMTSIELFVVPEALKNDPAVLEALGFTLNKNLNKYFYVQTGTGCVLATNMKKAVEKLTEFLESKRNAANENQNNGLILLCKNQNYLSALMHVLNVNQDLTLNTIKGFGLLDSVCNVGEIQINMVGNGVCLSATVVTGGSRSEEILAKSKSEILFKALEAGLQVCNPGYETFVQPHCFPVDGSKVKILKTKMKNLDAFYDLELFLAAELKSHQVEVYLEGLYANEVKDLRHKSDIVAHKFCQILVNLNLDVEILQAKYAQSGLFTINPDLILDQMDQAHRLKVLNQTRACIDFVRKYFRSSVQ